MADVQGLAPYMLQCLTPPTQADFLIEVFTDKAQRFRHSIRRMGGCWEASFHFPLSTKTNDLYLLNWFEQRLGYRILERSRGVHSWLGLVWEMELTLDGITERRSLGDVFNAVKVIYTDTNDVAQETSWYTNDTSIGRYMRRELILTLDQVTAAQAEAEAQAELSHLLDAWPQTVDTDVPPERDGLNVTVVGTIFTANNRYVTAGDGSSQNISTFIDDIIDTDCDYLTAGRISTNTTQVKTSFSTPIRAWDALLQLATAGDGSTPWLLYADPQGFVHYEAADPNPRYEWRGRELGMRSMIGELAPWLAWPGVMRNITKKKGTPIPGSFLLDSRDTWISEVEMGQGRPYPILKPEGFDDGAIERAANEFSRWLAEEDA